MGILKHRCQELQTGHVRADSGSACNANAIHSDNDDIDRTTVVFDGTSVDDEENGWAVKWSQEKQKGTKATFESPRGQTKPLANHKLVKEPTAH